jgi:hypothetical protein
MSQQASGGSAMPTLDYRGYRVEYHFADRWIARIYRPNESNVMSSAAGGIQTATKEEGEGRLLQMARA